MTKEEAGLVFLELKAKRDEALTILTAATMKADHLASWLNIVHTALNGRADRVRISDEIRLSSNTLGFMDSPYPSETEVLDVLETTQDCEEVVSETATGYRAAMDDDRVNDRIDEAVLALLYLGIVERHPTAGARTWKSFDWDAMGRLHEKGLISDPVSKAKSVVLTDTGLRRAEVTFHRLFESGD